MEAREERQGTEGEVEGESSQGSNYESLRAWARRSRVCAICFRTECDGSCLKNSVGVQWGVAPSEIDQDQEFENAVSPKASRIKIYSSLPFMFVFLLVTLLLWLLGMLGHLVLSLFTRAAKAFAEQAAEIANGVLNWIDRKF